MVLKVVGSTLDWASHGLAYPAVNWVPFSNQGRIRQQKVRDGLCLSYADIKYSRPLTPTGPIVTKQ